MKKILVFISAVAAVWCMTACSTFTGITYSQSDDTYLLTKDAPMYHKIYKCKKVDKRLVCKELGGQPSGAQKQ